MTQTIGYPDFEALLTVIMCTMFLICNAVAVDAKGEAIKKTVKITIPENLDYSGAFDDIFSEYTKKRAS